MSNVLAKNRKPLPNELKALTMSENLTKSIAEMCYNENKIPKRRRNIGERILFKSMTTYEFLREANDLYCDTKDEMIHRKNYLYNAEKNAFDVCSDIRILPSTVTTISHKNPWYNQMQAQAVETCKIVKNFRKADEKRMAKIKFNKETGFKEVENNIKKPIKPFIKITDKIEDKKQ